MSKEKDVFEKNSTISDITKDIVDKFEEDKIQSKIDEKSYALDEEFLERDYGDIPRETSEDIPEEIEPSEEIDESFEDEDFQEEGLSDEEKLEKDKAKAKKRAEEKRLQREKAENRERERLEENQKKFEEERGLKELEERNRVKQEKDNADREQHNQSDSIYNGNTNQYNAGSDGSNHSESTQFHQDETIITPEDSNTNSYVSSDASQPTGFEHPEEPNSYIPLDNSYKSSEVKNTQSTPEDTYSHQTNDRIDPSNPANDKYTEPLYHNPNETGIAPDTTQAITSHGSFQNGSPKPPDHDPNKPETVNKISTGNDIPNNYYNGGSQNIDNSGTQQTTSQYGSQDSSRAEFSPSKTLNSSANNASGHLYHSTPRATELARPTSTSFEDVESNRSSRRLPGGDIRRTVGEYVVKNSGIEESDMKQAYNKIKHSGIGSAWSAMAEAGASSSYKVGLESLKRSSYSNFESALKKENIIGHNRTIRVRGKKDLDEIAQHIRSFSKSGAGRGMDNVLGMSERALRGSIRNRRGIYSPEQIEIMRKALGLKRAGHGRRVRKFGAARRLARSGIESVRGNDAIDGFSASSQLVGRTKNIMHFSYKTLHYSGKLGKFMVLRPARKVAVFVARQVSNTKVGQAAGYTGRVIANGVNNVRLVTANAVDDAKGEAAKTIGKAGRRVVNGYQKTSVGRFQGRVSTNIKGVKAGLNKQFNSIANSKFGRGVRKFGRGAGRFGRGVGKVGKGVGSAFKFAGRIASAPLRLVNTVSSFFKGLIIKGLVIIGGIIAAIYLLYAVMLMVDSMLNSVIGFFTKEVDGVETTLEEDDSVELSIASIGVNALKKKTEGWYATIDNLLNAKDTTINSDYPDITQYTKITKRFIDGDGNEIASEDNVKEILSMASVHLNFDDIGLIQMPTYISTMWELSHSYEIVESDVYFCTTEEEKASCNNVKEVDYRCEQDNGAVRDECWEKNDLGEDVVNCKGHKRNECKGHIDVEAVITIKGLTEENGLYSIVQTEVPSTDFEGWDEEARERVDVMMEQDWMEEYGVEIPRGMTGEGLTNSQIQGLLSNTQETDPARLGMVRKALSAVGVINYDLTTGEATNTELSGIAKGIDCSGFVCWAVWGATGNRYTYTTAQLENIGTVFYDLGELRPGDIILRKAKSGQAYGHTGIYIGDGKYVHASSAKTGIKVSPFHPEDWEYLINPFND